MKRNLIIAAAVAAMISPVAAQETTKEAFASTLGVNPDYYTLLELQQLSEAAKENDWSTYGVMQRARMMRDEEQFETMSSFEVPADMDTSVMVVDLSEIEFDTSVKQAFASTLGIEPDNYTLNEILLIREAARENDWHTYDQLVSQNVL